MHRIVVTGHPRRAGKTTVLAGVAALLRARGLLVGASGAIEGASAALEAHGVHLHSGTPAVSPTPLDVELVEASGIPDLADDARVIPVARYHAGLSAAAIVQESSALGAQLAGVVLNAIPKSFLGYAKEVLIPELQAAGVTVLGLLPVDEHLQMVTIGELADAIGGRFVNDADKRDDLLEHLLVGARSWDPASPYLERKNGFAFITRGDLQDVQTAAINDNTHCIVLTGGHGPSVAVRYRAAEAGIPIITVGHDTVEALRLLDRAMSTARFTHPGKVARVVTLMASQPGFARFIDSIAGTPAQAPVAA